MKLEVFQNMDYVAIIKASKFSIRNRIQLEGSYIAGCYCCLAIFGSVEVKEWIDGESTALCPYCGVDAVLGNNSPYIINLEVLKELQSYWFNYSAK